MDESYSWEEATATTREGFMIKLPKSGAFLRANFEADKEYKTKENERARKKEIKELKEQKARINDRLKELYALRGRPI
jgi:hypothetical protein